MIKNSHHVSTINIKHIVGNLFCFSINQHSNIDHQGGYLRTKRLLIRVAGTQNTITSTSAMARLAINRFVTVLMRGTRKTTEITNRFPTSPTLNTSV